MRRNDTQYSRFWMGDDSDFSCEPKNVSLWDAESLIKLASFKRAITNFVRIVTGKSIPVVYNTGTQSYTSGKMVVLSAKLEHNQFDTAVGTALHEGTHCLLTDFKIHTYMQTYQKVLVEMVVKNIPLSELSYRFRNRYGNDTDATTAEYIGKMLSIDPAVMVSVISRMYKLLGSDISLTALLESQLWEQSKWFENWVEDRRIDYYQAKNSPGYRGYYNSMYESYFYTKLVGKGVKAKNYARKEDWASYRFRVTNILHPHTDLDALKGLREIWDVIDLKNVDKLTSVLDSWMKSFAILDVMYKYLEVEKKRTEKKSTPKVKLPGKTVAEHEYEDEIDENEEPSDETPDSPYTQDQDDNQTGDDNFDASQPNNMGGEKSDEKSDEESEEESDEESEEGGEEGEESDEESDEKGEEGDAEGDESDDSSDEKSDEEGDDASNSGEDKDDVTPAQMQKMKEEEDKQGRFLEGETPKKKMDKKLNQALDAVDKGGVSLEGVGEGLTDWHGNPIKIQCVFIRNVTKEIIESGAFDEMFTVPGSWRDSRDSATNQKAVEEGFRLGTMLGKKLQIRNESRSTRFSRLETGRIDKRLLASLGYQNDRVFYRTMVEKYNPLMLHVSVDASGSMSGQKWIDTMTTLVAIIKAASMTQNLHVVVSMRGTTEGTNKKVTRNRNRNNDNYNINTRPLVAIVYDSRVDKLSKVMSLFKYIRPGGITPEGLAFEPIVDEMVVGKKGEMESIFVNLSDGQPYYQANIYDGENKRFTDFSYGGEIAGKHTGSIVQKMRSLNIKILSYIIGDDSDSDYESSDWRVFKMCYGKDSRKIDTKNIVALARTLNEKFLEKSN
jgi:hypothetical protein